MTYQCHTWQPTETAQMKLSVYTMQVYTMQHAHLPSHRVSASLRAHSFLNEGHLGRFDHRTTLSKHTTTRLARDRERLAHTTPTDHVLLLSTLYTWTDTRTHVQQRSRADVSPASFLQPCCRRGAVITPPPTRSGRPRCSAVACTTLILTGTRFSKDSLDNSYPLPSLFLPPLCQQKIFASEMN